MIMTSSQFKLRTLQALCLLVQVFILWIFAFFIAAVFVSSGKGPAASGPTFKGWCLLFGDFLFTLMLYWAVGLIRRCLSNRLRATHSTLPETASQPHSSALR